MPYFGVSILIQSAFFFFFIYRFFLKAEHEKNEQYVQLLKQHMIKKK